MLGSIYTRMAIALERYLTVCHPFYRVVHNWSAWVYIVPIAVTSLLYNLPKASFFNIRIQSYRQKQIFFTELGNKEFKIPNYFFVSEVGMETKNVLPSFSNSHLSNLRRTSCKV